MSIDVADYLFLQTKGRKSGEKKILYFNPTYSLRGSQGAWIQG
jgi:hypothetical protein